MITTFFAPRPTTGADPDARLERLGSDDWKSLSDHPLAVLILTKTDCPLCHEWQQTLSGFFHEGGADWTRGVRFGALSLDQPGSLEFKRSNPWIKDRVRFLPFNIIYTDGRITAAFAGGHLRRLARLLKRTRKAQNARRH